MLKYLALILILLSSSTAYAEWTKVVEGEKATFYVDVETIRKDFGYVYFWNLNDYSEPLE